MKVAVGGSSNSPRPVTLFRLVVLSCLVLSLPAGFLGLTFSMQAHAKGAARNRGDTAAWCAPGLVSLSDHVCFYEPKNRKLGPKGQRTLVIFLHSLVGAAPEAAWPQQLRMAQNAEQYGFSALIPRGRPGLGPGRDPHVLAWPTAQDLQEKFEHELLTEWRQARTAIANKSKRWDRVLLFGFSNGAYYASNLAFREAVDVDGVAVFAGGSGSKYQRLLAARAERRVPMFVGFGSEDPDHPRQEAMIKMLRQLHWPHRSLKSHAGHTVTDAQIRGALAFLGHRLPIAQ